MEGEMNNKIVRSLISRKENKSDRKNLRRTSLRVVMKRLKWFKPFCLKPC